jgi:predicted  nucleic acid-binding Zn-ribbon protein
VTKLNNADGLHAKEVQSMEEAFAARRLEMSSQLAETTANLEKAQEELEMLKKERQSAAELLEREREAVEKWKAESEVKVGKLEGRVRALESALEEKQGELKVRHPVENNLLSFYRFCVSFLETFCRKLLLWLG